MQIDTDRWNRAIQLAGFLTAEGGVPSLGFATGNATKWTPPVHAGWQTLDRSQRLVENPLFLIASVTKPVVATAIIMLIERGELSLADRVTRYFPDFGRNGKYGVEVRHLLTHTSGLPDQLPNNMELRQQQATLEEFFRHLCDQPLAFPPGRGVLYQSMGFLVLGEILQKVVGKSCGQFVREELFLPLGMTNSWLGGSAGDISPLAPRIAETIVPPEQLDGRDWNWNSLYWRRTGAPWGGMITSVEDLCRFAQFWLNQGRTAEGRQLLSPVTVAAATRNWLPEFRDLPEGEIRSRPWGLGWRWNWPATSTGFCDLARHDAYGHWGATGTVVWICPRTGVFSVVLTTLPFDQSNGQITRLSNALAAVWV